MTGYAADTEAAAAKINAGRRESGKMCKIHTPGIDSSIDEVAGSSSNISHLAATRKALALVGWKWQASCKSCSRHS